MSLAKPPAINWNAVSLIWTMRRIVDELPEAEKARVHAAERELREVLDRYGEEATWAFALVGIEVAYEP